MPKIRILKDERYPEYFLTDSAFDGVGKTVPYAFVRRYRRVNRCYDKLQRDLKRMYGDNE